MTIETVAIDSLSADPANARKHGQRNLDAIAASLRRFGQQKAIVVDSHGVVRAGNGQLAAAKLLGWTEIRVVRSDLPATELTAFAIADNRTAELAEWDLDALTDQLSSLDDEAFNLGDVGFSEDELRGLSERLPTGLKELDALQPPPMTWTLIGIPTVRFGEIAARIESLAKIPGVVLETASNDATGEDGQR